MQDARTTGLFKTDSNTLLLIGLLVVLLSWVARLVWLHLHTPAAQRPSTMTREQLVNTFGGVFEHSPWIVERAYDTQKLGTSHDTATGLHSALVPVFRSATEAERLGVLKAHPDLAGRLAAAKRLTPESMEEQASAGLDALTDDERAAFTELNNRYTKTFGFPFIIAVRGLTKDDILTAFRRRVANDRATEFEEACHQVERIALLRLNNMLPN